VNRAFEQAADGCGSMEIFIGNPADFEAVVPRCLGALSFAVNLFVEQMRKTGS
jgi:hypothetical protein